MTEKTGHFTLFAVVGLLFVSLIPLTPTVRAKPSVATVIGVTFSQVDFFFNGSLVQLYSNWGESTTEFIPGDNLAFINVVANASGPNEWIIQNLPLFPSSLVSSDNMSFSTYFDLGLLGVTNGVQIPSLYYAFTQSDTPANSTPDVVPTLLAPVGRDSALTNSGVPSGETGLGSPPAAIVYNFTKPVNIVFSFHKDMPNCIQGAGQCGPGSAANSLQWLAQENNWPLKNRNIQDTLRELVADMGCDHKGAWDDKFADGKLAFAAAHGLNIDNHYAGGSSLPREGNYRDVVINDGKVSWNYIKQEFDKGEDVEIMTDHHWVVLEGYVSFDNVHMVEYRDDPYQLGDATNETQKEEIAKRHVWTTFDQDAPGVFSLHDDGFVQTVFSESPKPTVGGIAVPIDKLGLLGPYIGLALTILVGAIATVVYVNHTKRRKEKQ